MHKQEHNYKEHKVAYNSVAEAIKKLRAKKMSLDTFLTPEDIEEGLVDETEGKKEIKETDLAPSLKGKPLHAEMEDGEMELETEHNPEEEMSEKDMVPTRSKDKQIAAQALGHDQGDAMSEEEILKSMYQPGDENKKGFMGKAAMLIKKKIKG